LVYLPDIFNKPPIRHGKQLKTEGNIFEIAGKFGLSGNFSKQSFHRKPNPNSFSFQLLCSMKNLLAFLLILSSSLLSAQSPTDNLAVHKTIDKLFDSMRAGDSTSLRSVFDPTARLQTTFTNKEGTPVLKSEKIDRFVAAVGTPHEEVWDEKIWSYDVHIDGNLATVWTDYTFYAGDKMSHCGVNAFHLFRSQEGWKITQITDTRRRKDCQTKPSDDQADINSLLDGWHRAAALADEDVFFGSMTTDGIYLGTDASEKWLRDEMKEWSKKYFEQESAWDFKPHDREIYFSADHQTAWFDELLDTWMGTCRGSGVLRKEKNGWELAHYNLAMLVPNDKTKGVIELIQEKK